MFLDNADRGADAANDELVEALRQQGPGDRTIGVTWRAARLRYDPWRDARDIPIPLRCRVEQITVAKEHGALRSRLHKQGEVVDRRGTRLVVRFDGEGEPVSIRPHLVRVLGENP